MNESFDTSERGPVDFIVFGMMFYGFLLTLAGVVMTSIGVTVLGALVLGFGTLALWLIEKG